MLRLARGLQTAWVFPRFEALAGDRRSLPPGSSLEDASHSGAMSQPNSDFNRFLGMDVARAENGECEMVLDVDERHMSIAERVHGGVFFTMVDTAMGRAVTSILDQGRGCATIEAKINYFRPVQAGRVRAIARCTNKSRRTAYTEAEVRDDEDRLIAKATGTFMLTETMAQKERERF